MNIRARHIAIAIPASILMLFPGSVALASPHKVSPQVGHEQSNTVNRPSVYMIGFTSEQTFWNSVEKGSVAAARTYGVDLHYVVPLGAGSDSTMIPLIETAIAAHPAGIALEYAGSDMESVTLQAVKSGAHVVLYNNDRYEKTTTQPGTTNPLITSLPFVGQNEDLSGGVVASAFVKYLPPSGNVLIINPNPSSVVLGLRAHAAESVLTADHYSYTQLIETEDPIQAEEATGAYLEAHPTTAGMISLNIDGVDPAVQYEKQHHLNVPIVGFDLNPVAFNDLRQQPTLKILLDQQPYLQGYMAVEDLALEIKDGFTGVNVNTGTLIIDKQNAASVGKLISLGDD